MATKSKEVAYLKDFTKEMSTELAGIEKTIKTAASNVANGYIDIGKALLQARALFPGDLQFGRWREQNTPIETSHMARVFMQTAERFGARKDLHRLPATAMRALLSAPDSVVDDIEQDIQDDKPVPSRKEVVERKKGAQEDPIPDDQEPKKDDKPSTEEIAKEAARKRREALDNAPPSDAPQEDKDAARMNNMLSLDLEFRIKNNDSCWAVFGLNDQCDGDPCNKDVPHILYRYFSSELEADDPLLHKLNIAYDEINDYFRRV